MARGQRRGVLKGNSAEFYRERAKKYANTPRKSIHAESTKNSIDRMKRQWEKWEPKYVENEAHSNGSSDFVLSLRLPPLLKLALLRTSRVFFIGFWITLKSTQEAPWRPIGSF